MSNLTWNIDTSSWRVDMLTYNPPMTWKPETPFNQIPLLPPEVDIETKPILKACIKARAGLAELKQAAELFPHQAILINTLPLLEAKDSSEIENIVTTSDTLFQSVNNASQADYATNEVLQYRTALLEGFQALQQRPLTTNITEMIGSTIKGIDMKVRKVPGTTLANHTTGKCIYTPPEGETHLRNLLGN